MARSPEERFWAKVDKDGPIHPQLKTRCWLWTGAQLRGYGLFRLNSQRMIVASRYAYWLASGQEPEKVQIDHRCHVTLCVNPHHLRPATNKQNAENPNGLYSNNSSGIRGVSWANREKRWRGAVGHKGKMIDLGLFDTAEQAGEAARLKRLELFSHNDSDRWVDTPT